MSNPTLEEIKEKPRPQQLLRSVIFVPGKTDDNNAEFLLDKEPYCLLAQSLTFKFTLFRELTFYAKPFHPFELEELTMLSYKMSIISLHKQLWTTYLQSGTGELEKSHPVRRQDEKTELHYWPTYLHSFTVARAFVKRMTGDVMDHEMRAAFVKEYLSYLEEQLHKYAAEYETMKNTMPLYTPVLTYRIDECVRKHALSAVQIYFDVLITLMKHDYMNRFMQLQYWQQKPMHEQVHKVNRICQLACANSIAGQEHYFFREDVYFKKILGWAISSATLAKNQLFRKRCWTFCPSSYHLAELSLLIILKKMTTKFQWDLTILDSKQNWPIITFLPFGRPVLASIFTLASPFLDEIK